MPFVPPPPVRPPRSLEVITGLIEKYGPSFRRWCDVEKNGPCACMGCVRWPAFSTLPYPRDPEGAAFPDPDDQLTRGEVEIYLAAQRSTKATP